MAAAREGDPLMPAPSPPPDPAKVTNYTYCTGMTEEQFEARKQMLRHLEESGSQKQSMAPRCYLCRRDRGDHSILYATISPRGAAVARFTVRIGTLEVYRTPKEVFAYPLCGECQLLLQGIAGVHQTTMLPNG
ncbi:MAG: hypothetical protein AB1505_32780 [Candidatus Latescibacterota bacterium]